MEPIIAVIRFQPEPSRIALLSSSILTSATRDDFGLEGFSCAVFQHLPMLSWHPCNVHVFIVAVVVVLRATKEEGRGQDTFL
jgi:hypothetical protein